MSKKQVASNMSEAKKIIREYEVIFAGLELLSKASTSANQADTLEADLPEYIRMMVEGNSSASAKEKATVFNLLNDMDIYYLHDPVSYWVSEYLGQVTVNYVHFTGCHTEPDVELTGADIFFDDYKGVRLATTDDDDVAQLIVEYGTQRVTRRVHCPAVIEYVRSEIDD